MIWATNGMPEVKGLQFNCLMVKIQGVSSAFDTWTVSLMAYIAKRKIVQEIKYIKGDATRPARPGNKIIVHVCNDIGGWGRGFVMALSARWKEPEQSYRQWFSSKENFAL